MKKTTSFDVLVVYTERVATSASSKKTGNINPFALAKKREHYAIAYSYFLRKCELSGLKAALCTSADITGPGTGRSYWIYKNGKWIKNMGNAFAPIIFDKVSPLRQSMKKKRKLLFSENLSQPFNDLTLLNLFNDKLKTHNRLKSYSIPTVNITTTTIDYAILQLNKLIFTQKNSHDFSKNFILKDRFGAGGIDIYKIEKNYHEEIFQILKNNPKVSFVLQPFTNFEKGYSNENISGFADIRIIYSQGKVVQRYIRTAKINDFRCNEHQGGEVHYINKFAIPHNVSLASDSIIRALNNKNALYALDFIVSNSGHAYFLEGNINPGIYWGINSTADKINTKKLIRTIITEIKRRTELLNPILTQPAFTTPVFIPSLQRNPLIS